MRTKATRGRFKQLFSWHSLGRTGAEGRIWRAPRAETPILRHPRTRSHPEDKITWSPVLCVLFVAEFHDDPFGSWQGLKSPIGPSCLRYHQECLWWGPSQPGPECHRCHLRSEFIREIWPKTERYYDLCLLEGLEIAWSLGGRWQSLR